MARRRLNKKVALIGGLSFVLLAIMAILVILHFSRDPQKFILDGDTALSEEQYDVAEKNYRKAYSSAKSDSLRIDILFKLENVYIRIDEWRKVLGCWSQIIQLDPKNIKARLGRLRYIYMLADNGARRVWKDVAAEASEFLEKVDEELLAEDVAKWDVFESEQDLKGRKIGPYLYMVKGRAALENAIFGVETEPERSLAKAVNDMERVIELEPSNVDAYKYLAAAIYEKGRIAASKGSIEERDKAVQEAMEVLNKAVEIAGDNPESHINLLAMRFRKLSDQKASLEKLLSLEPQYLSLVKKFDSSDKAFGALAMFYLRAGTEKLDKAIEAAEKSFELDKENVLYAYNVADLHYRKYSIYKDIVSLYKAIKTLNIGLTLPDSQEQSGPNSWKNKVNRITLYSLLAQCYLEQAIEPFTEELKAKKQEWLEKAEDVVHKLEQLYDSGDDPEVQKWQGMLEFAKGNKSLAIRRLYATYEQLLAAKATNWLVSYTLGKFFINTSEIGAAREFLGNAIESGVVGYKPEALLYYVEVSTRLRRYNEALSVLDIFEERFNPSQRSKLLKIEAYIGSGQFDEAGKELEKADSADPNTIKLQLALTEAHIEQLKNTLTRKRISEGEISSVSESPQPTVEPELDEESIVNELKNYGNDRIRLVEKLLSVDPNLIRDGQIITLCNDYIVNDQIDKAENIVDLALKQYPDSPSMLFYKQLLLEPDPKNISQQRRNEIELFIRKAEDNPINQAVGLGLFYQGHNEPNKAIEEYKKALGMKELSGGELQIPGFASEDTEKNLQLVAAANLFDLAVSKENWKLAEQLIANVGKGENIDGCEGQFFEARIAMAQKDYKRALEKLDMCLTQRPVFSQAYILRSSTQAALGNMILAVEDARKAASLNPLDSFIVRTLALTLCRRNDQLGGEVSADQMIEARDALIRAIRLNPGSWELQSFYAEYISQDRPNEALAIRQRLQKLVPNFQNAILLGNMAMRLANKETNEEKKNVYFGLAAKAFEQALTIEPKNQSALNNYAEYYRQTGQEGKAQKMLEGSSDEKLLFTHYLRLGQYGKARKIAEESYKKNPADVMAVRQLALISERTFDQENTKKFSEELLKLEDKKENHLYQIGSFLRVGLIKEAEHKLASFNEKYPEEPSSLLLGAWLSMRKGQLEMALDLVNQSLQIDRDNASPWRLRGEINYYLANYNEAVRDLKKSKAILDTGNTRIALAKAYLKAGLQEDAITELKDTIEQPEAPAEARELLEQMYLQTGRDRELFDFYRETLEEFPDNVAWLNKVGAFAIKQKDYNGAEKFFKKASEISRKAGKVDLSAFDGYLYSLVLEGKFDKVLEVAKKNTEGDLAPVAFFRMAEAKMKLGDEQIARQYCRKAVEKAGTNETILTNILKEINLLFGAEEVEKLCLEKLNESPDSLAANFSMYESMRIQKRYNKAIDYIDRCLNIADANGPITLNYMVHKARMLQQIYDRTTDKDYLQRCVKLYQSLLEKVPNNSSILNNLAYMLTESGYMLDEALEYAEAACEIQPNNAGYMDTYAYTLYKNEKYDEAAELIQAALQQFENDKISAPWEAYKHLGQIKEALQQNEQALAAYKQSLNVGADKMPEKIKKEIKQAIERVSK